jgi:hypothetical protein
MARVLVVENSDTVRTMLCDAVKAAAHTADCAATQQDAEELISASIYDLVICTMVLPDGSGLELAVKAADLGMGTMVMSGQPRCVEGNDPYGRHTPSEAIFRRGIPQADRRSPRRVNGQPWAVFDRDHLYLRGDLWLQPRG